MRPDRPLPPLATLHEQLRQRRFRSRDLVERALAILERSPWGAFVEVSAARARHVADRADGRLDRGKRVGPLTGIPWSAKDLYGVPGTRTRAGSPRPLPKSWERAGPLVAHLALAGAPCIGKTHTVEFAFGGLGTNPHHPVPRNPCDPVTPRVPGGSSSGAGVSIREGSSLFALATDTSGSVRVPASFTGTVGLKTTHGVWPTRGIVPLSPVLDTAGILTRTVHDAAFAYAALDPILRTGGTGPWEALHAIESMAKTRLSLGIPRHLFWDDCEPGIAEAVMDALRAAERAGAVSLREVEFPVANDVYELFLSGGPAAYDLLSFLDRELPEWLPALDPNVSARLAPSRALDEAEYQRRRERVKRLAARSVRAWSEARVAALVTPTVPIGPPALAAVATPEGYARHNVLALRNTCVASYGSLCAVSLPCGVDARGLPVGLQVMTGPTFEMLALAAGLALERTIAAR